MDRPTAESIVRRIHENARLGADIAMELAGEADDEAIVLAGFLHAVASVMLSPDLVLKRRSYEALMAVLVENAAADEAVPS